jgi:hypothetical protein
MGSIAFPKSLLNEVREPPALLGPAWPKRFVPGRWRVTGAFGTPTNGIPEINVQVPRYQDHSGFVRFKSRSQKSGDRSQNTLRSGAVPNPCFSTS